MHKNTLTNNVKFQFYLWNSSFNTLFKIKHTLYIDSGSPPPPLGKISGYPRASYTFRETVKMPLCKRSDDNLSYFWSSTQNCSLEWTVFWESDCRSAVFTRTRLDRYPELLEFDRQSHTLFHSLHLISFFLSYSDFFLLTNGRCRELFLQFIILNDTHTLGRIPLDEGSARRRDLSLTTHNTHKWQTSMPPVGIGPAVPATERPLTHALNCRSARSTFMSPISSLSFEFLRSC